MKILMIMVLRVVLCHSAICEIDVCMLLMCHNNSCSSSILCGQVMNASVSLHLYFNILDFGGLTKIRYLAYLKTLHHSIVFFAWNVIVFLMCIIICVVHKPSEME